MRVRASILAVVILAGTAAIAQVRPIFDPDDFLDARARSTPLFISRLVLGFARGSVDDYRPLHQDTRFLHLSNSFYWSNFQVNYKHSEVRGESVNGPEQARVCPCDPPVYFPTTTAPLPGTKNALQFAFYRTQRGAPAEPPVMLRYQVSILRQDIETVATYLQTDHVAARLHGHEQSIGVEADTYFRFKEHDIFGTLFVARTTRSGTALDGSHSELGYTGRLPGKTFGRVLTSATLTVGRITGRGSHGLNLINPAFEALWHEWRTRANVRLVWSPLATRSGSKGWVTHHQILISVDRALFVKLLASH